ncbi:hypothetical protein [Cerasicoccus fimbriatus]|uniref:hypothetical protein n=1 Tax=Cerasicoccus fimbriatus TaxID=3014554 RepID=UPI0022B3DF9C|nr:hypothetical protein [Cerasicoccus sp. TK19100]
MVKHNWILNIAAIVIMLLASSCNKQGNSSVDGRLVGVWRLNVPLTLEILKSSNIDESVKAELSRAYLSSELELDTVTIEISKDGAVKRSFPGFPVQRSEVVLIDGFYQIGNSPIVLQKDGNLRISSARSNVDLEEVWTKE